MESEIPSTPSVNATSAEVADNSTAEYAGFERVTPPPAPDKSPREIPAVARRDLLFYLDRYCLGVFRDGKDWEWAVDLRRKYAKARGRNLKDLEDVFPEYMRWTQNFTFRLEPYKNTRRICIYPKRARDWISEAEIIRRLGGAITRHMRGRKQACIDLTFLGYFQQLTGLEPNAIRHAWEQIFWLKGFRVRWNARRTCFYVSHGVKAHPESSAGISLLRRKDQKTSGYAGPESEESAATESPSEAVPMGREAEKTPGDISGRPTTAHGGDDQRKTGALTSGEARAGPWEIGPPAHGNPRAGTALQPFPVGDRWIVPRKNEKFVRWLAFVALQGMHAANWRVKFGGQTVNFARAAIAAGFEGSEICAAYRQGLAVSQASAEQDYERIEEGRDRVGFVWREWEKRAPSQAVNIAWKILRADTRSDEERWTALFSRRPQPVRADKVAKAVRERNRPAPSYRTIGPGLRVRSDIASPEPARPAATAPADPLPSLLRAMSREHLEEKPLRTIEQFVKLRGLTMAALFKLPRPDQAAILQAARAWQKEGAPDLP